MFRKNFLQLVFTQWKEVVVQGGTCFTDKNSPVDNKVRSFIFHTVDAIIVKLVLSHDLGQIGPTLRLLILGGVFYEVNWFRLLIKDVR